MQKIVYTEIYNPNKNFLFTLDQLNSVRTNDKCLPVRCVCCGNIFHITRKQYTNFLRGYKTLQYCSNKCSHDASNHSVTKPCLLCGKPVTKSQSESIKYPNFFCCRSHAASYNNSRRAPRSEESRAKTSATIQKQRPKQPPKPCKICGQVNCVRPDVCHKGILTQRSPNLQKLSFDVTSFGSLRVYE